MFLQILHGLVYYSYILICGAVAQLVERMDGIHEATGSTPVSSTSLRCFATSSGLRLKRNINS